jgi:hypothetical protein
MTVTATTTYRGWLSQVVTIFSVLGGLGKLTLSSVSGGKPWVHRHIDAAGDVRHLTVDERCRIVPTMRILELVGIIVLASFVIGAAVGMPRKRHGKPKQ